jgi:hypothetical protein
MTPVTSELLAGIENNDAEAFLGAGESLLAFKWGTSGLVQPFDHLLATYPPQQADIDALKAALIAFVKREPNPNTVTAIFALGKFEDPRLIPLFREKLALHTGMLSEQSSIVHNIIIALANHDEHIISGDGAGCLDATKSLHDARIYLANPAKKVF